MSDQSISLQTTIGNPVFISLAYGGGTYAALCSDGILTSSDGITFTRTFSNAVFGFESYANKIRHLNGRFIALAQSHIIVSADGYQWQAIRLSPTGEPDGPGFYDITYGHGKYLVVGGSAVLMTSTDGVTWTSSSSDPVVSGFQQNQNSFYSAYFDGSTFFVGVDAAMIISSPDGLTWTQCTMPDSLSGWEIPYAITYNGSSYVAVGEGNITMVLTSTDGVSWTDQSPSFLDGQQRVTLFDVCWGNSRFVMVSDSSLVVTTPDLSSYTMGDAICVGQTIWGSVIWNGTHFYTLGSTQGFSYIRYSADGIAWTTIPAYPPSQNFNGLAYGNNILVGSSLGFYTSTDNGTTWTSNLAATSAINNTANLLLNQASYLLVAFINNQFIAWTTDSAFNGVPACIFTSPDGLNWTQRTNFSPPLTTDGNQQEFTGIAYSGSVYCLIGYDKVSSDDAGFSATSADSINWTTHTSNIAASFESVAYGNSKFVVVGSTSGGTTTFLATSADGATWTSRTPAVAAYENFLTAVVYDGTHFVAGFPLQYSSDGVTWTASTAPSDALTYNQLVVTSGGIYAFGFRAIGNNNGGLCYSTDHGVTFTALPLLGDYLIYNFTKTSSTYVAVTANDLLTSTNGTTFTVLTTNPTACATSADNSGNYFALVPGAVRTSTDGYNWSSPRLTGFGSISDCIYVGGTHYAVGGNIYTSTDGLTWTKRDAADVQRLAHGNSTFVGVGTGIMTSANGTTWTANTDASLSAYSLYVPIYDVAFGNGTFVAITSTKKFLTSTTPSGAWASADFPNNSGQTTSITAISFVNGRFYASGYQTDSGSVVTPVILSGTNGTTWTFEQIAPGTSRYLSSRVLGDSNLLCVYCGSKGGLVTKRPNDPTWVTVTNTINKTNFGYSGNGVQGSFFYHAPLWFLTSINNGQIVTGRS